MFRDPTGAEYTNLCDSGGDEKRDIYMRVAEVGSESVKYDDENIREFWKDKPISRGMAKRPVMTFCYGSTLKSCIGYVCDGLAETSAQPILDDEGKMLYTLHKLAVPVAKALRRGVVQTVPAAAQAMQYFQNLARRCSEPLRWITPSGMPVVNYIEGELDKQVFIRSMGITKVLVRQKDGMYNTRKAAAAISPNIVHSLDASHLCMTLVACDFDVVPIHDSFACLPCNVDAMHKALREQFVELYQHDLVQQLRAAPLKKGMTEPTPPETGLFDLRSVLSSRFVFC